MRLAALQPSRRRDSRGAEEEIVDIAIGHRVRHKPPVEVAELIPGEVELSKRTHLAPRHEPAAVPRRVEERERVLDRISPVPRLNLGEDNRAIAVEDAGRALENLLFVTLNIAFQE